MTKKNIARQFIYEIAAVAVVAIMLGGLIGSLSSVPVTNALLSATASQTTEESFDRGGPGGDQMQPPEDMQQDDQSGSSDSTEATATSSTGSETVTADRGDFRPPGMQDYVDSVTSAANLQVILEMMLIGLALIAVSGGAAMAGVMKYDPLQILTTRD